MFEKLDRHGCEPGEGSRDQRTDHDGVLPDLSALRHAASPVTEPPRKMESGQHDGQADISQPRRNAPHFGERRLWR